MFLLFLVFDGLVLLGLIYMLNEGERPSLIKAVVVSFLISLSFLAFAIKLGPSWGMLSLAPMAVLTPLVIWTTCDLSVGRSAVVGAILFVYKMVFWIVF